MTGRGHGRGKGFAVACGVPAPIRATAAHALARLLPVLGLSLGLAACYESHLRPGEGDEPFDFLRRFEPPADPALERLEPVVPTAPPPEAVVCAARPAEQCVAAFPRVMIVMDASSSMLAGDGPGDTNWDKARLALAGNPTASDSFDPGFVQPAFEREIEVQGNRVTMEDVFHLGLLAFNNDTALMLQYAPCASDNIQWAMDPYVSCEPPLCTDPYSGMPVWTFKNSDVDREAPFVQTTHSYMPPCNGGAAERCVGSSYNTHTEQGLLAAVQNITDYREDSGGFELTPSTPFALILITDGATSPGSLPVPVLEGLFAKGIRTFVIGLAPKGSGAPSTESSREELDAYARAGGTGSAALIEPDEAEIADAFADAVARIIVEIGTDPCCLPNDCSRDGEPPAP
ncbi:MAG: VWA domain-containing protein [Myxococcales bacterium]|nr:VWA domain-containing protein [Myxococcales bacterium]